MAHRIELTNGITNHAKQRMSTRSINESQIEQVPSYVRKAYCNKAVIYTIGSKEVEEKGRFLEPCEGIHVLCALDDGSIITTYRNHDLKGLRNTIEMNRPRSHKR